MSIHENSIGIPVDHMILLLTHCFTFCVLQVQEPLLLLGKERFAGVDIRVRVKGGGHVSQIYAIRQAISKSLVAYYQKCKMSFLPLPDDIGFIAVK